MYDQKTGIIEPMDKSVWDIRPSPHLGTLEVPDLRWRVQAYELGRAGQR